MNKRRLIDVVSTLGAQDPELTIYVTEPWTWESEAVVAREPDDGGVPAEAAVIAASYFLEVFLAREFFDDWTEGQRPGVTPKEQCERLIQYATHDA